MELDWNEVLPTGKRDRWSEAEVFGSIDTVAVAEDPVRLWARTARCIINLNSQRPVSQSSVSTLLQQRTAVKGRYPYLTATAMPGSAKILVP